MIITAGGKKKSVIKLPTGIHSRLQVTPGCQQRGKVLGIEPRL
jgi:hypothetical protein